MTQCIPTVAWQHETIEHPDLVRSLYRPVAHPELVHGSVQRQLKLCATLDCSFKTAIPISLGYTQAAVHQEQTQR